MTEDMGLELAAALNGHEVTDDNGQVGEGETPTEVPAASEEKTPEEVTTPAEKPQQQEAEPEHVEDESGKRYVPENRFKEVYGKQKATERELNQLKQQLQQRALPPIAPVKGAKAPDKTELLEVEFLKERMPQFDPSSESYSPELDDMGFQIFEANKASGMTRIEAAKKAISLAKKLADQELSVKQEARLVKSQQADQGITTKIVSRNQAEVDPNKMTEKEMENYLKSNGQW